MRAERIKLNEAKIQYRGLVNAAMYVHSSSVNSREFLQELCNKDSTACGWLL